MASFKSEKISQLYEALEESPDDVTAWTLLFNQAQLCEEGESEQVYSRFFKKFPYAGRYLALYAQREIKRKNYSAVEELFDEKLLACPNIDLWKTYLSYMSKKKKEEIGESDKSEFREGMMGIYDFVLDNMGLDIAAGSIWREYIDFLKNNWDTKGDMKEEGRKMEAIRKAYQRVIVLPIMNVEQFWKEYNLYENSLNKITAKKILDEKSSFYMNARAALKERKSLTDKLSLSSLALPVCNSPEEVQQVAGWLKYIAWEKANNYKLEDKDVIKRVTFAYNQALLGLLHFPQIWHGYAQFLIEKSMVIEAEALYERAIKCLPKSLLLCFSFADFQERRSNLEGCDTIYSNLLQYKDDAGDGVKDPSLVYIQYMRFALRSKAPQDARDVFKRALKDSRTGYQVFVVHALMEYYYNKNTKIPSKIFEKGLKDPYSFYNEPKYIFAYVDFLISIKEQNNVRVLFERLITMVKDKSVLNVIWSHYNNFEIEFGSVEQQIKIESRWNEAFEYDGGINAKTIGGMIERYSYDGLYSCTPEEMKSIGYQPQSSRSIGSSTEVESVQDIVENVASTGGGMYSRPDLKQLIPYKVESFGPLYSQTNVSTFHGLMVPDSVALVMRRLPPPMSFQGPYAMLDDLLVLIKQMVLPPSYPKRSARSMVVKNADEDSGQVRNSGGDEKRRPENRKGIKRGFKEEESEKMSAAIDDSSKAPKNDIFRKRQSKRMNL